jgi:predicted small lipoprotein YifL
MRTLLLALTLALTLAMSLAACSAKDEAAQQPVADQAAAAPEAPAAEAADPAASTHKIKEEIPAGPVGQVQLKDGTVLKIEALEKLGGDYWIYVTGKLNGRSSTVVSLTRFRDLMNWPSITFKDPHTFTITNKHGKEWVFQDANLYLGEGKAENYAFYVLDDRLDKVLTQVPKSEVINIAFGTK